jgi:pSer/pThr/pTyr-binding forkhead associated (FHA) protein
MGTDLTGRTEAPRVAISIVRGKATAATREMKGRSLLLGSGPQCDIQMRSHEVAPKHALITRGAAGAAVQSLDSDRPVFVNGAPVGEGLLADGDVLRIGPFELRVAIEGVAEAPVLVEPPPGPPPSPSAASPEVRFSLHQTMKRLAQLTGAARPVEAPVAPPAARIQSAAFQNPERFLDAQLEYAAREKELERRKRQISEESARIEADRQMLRQERGRLEAHKLDLERRSQEAARLDADLEHKTRQLDQRERDLHERELEHESRRIALTEESIRLDRTKEFLHARRSRLFRIRRRLLQQYRTRREQVQSLARELDERSLDLDRRLAAHEAEVQHWKRVADELGHRQAECKRAEADAARRVEAADRREQELDERRRKFEALVASVQQRDRSLDAEKAEVEARKARLAEEEIKLREARRVVDDQFDRARIRSAEIQQRHEEIEVRAAALERREQEWREKSAALDGRLKEQAEREARQAARATELEAFRDELERQRAELDRREAALNERAERIDRDRREVDLRIAEFDRRVREASLPPPVERVEAEHAAADAGDAPPQPTPGESAASAPPQPPPPEREDPHLRAEAIQTHVARLKAVSADLEFRQKQLLERERTWAEHVEGRQAKLGRLAEELRAQAASFEAETAPQQQRVSKLRGLAGRIFGLTPDPSASAENPAAAERLARAGERIAERERMESQRLADAQARRNAQIDAVLAELGKVHDERQASKDAQVILEAERRRIARLRDEADAQISSAAAPPAEGDAAGRLESTLRAWADQIAQAQQTIEIRKRELDERERELASSPPDAPGEESPAPLPTPASISIAAPRPAGAVRRSTVPVAIELSDDEIAARIVESGLLDEPHVRFHRQAAANRGARLTDELVRVQVLTPYQLRALAERGDAVLRLGDAVVRDVLHVGAVGTTYLVQLPGEEAPVAARMLHPQWSRDPAQRRQYEIVLESLRDFRHPNVVATLGPFWAAERFGALTEFVEAISLAELAPLIVPPPVLVHFCRQAVAAVAAAERAGLVHRAIRPSRLLVLQSGELRVLGYGEPTWLSKIHRCEKGRAASQFAAPEWNAAGGALDARADLYSIAQCCRWAAGSGRPAAQGDFPGEDFPEAFRSLVAAMLAPAPGQRPKPAEALALLDRIADPAAAADWPDLVAVFDAKFDPSVAKRAA